MDFFWKDDQKYWIPFSYAKKAFTRETDKWICCTEGWFDGCRDLKNKKYTEWEFGKDLYLEKLVTVIYASCFLL